MKKIFCIVFIIMALQTNLLTAQPVSCPAMYRLYPIDNSTSAWLLNVKTGALTKCISKSMNAAPICTQWSEVPEEKPLYRYDPKTGKLIPMNKAARNKEKEKDPLNIM